VYVHLRCIANKLKRISKMSTLPPPLEKFLRTPMTLINRLKPGAAACLQLYMFLWGYVTPVYDAMIVSTISQMLRAVAATVIRGAARIFLKGG